MFDIVGAWSLESSLEYRDDIPVKTYGDPPSGQIQYTADGRMSAFLMDPEWAKKGSLKAKPNTEFFAYAGRWHLEGNDVVHNIEYCNLPMFIGTRFVRTVEVLSPNRIELTTAPETSRSGAVYIRKLIWNRFAGE